MIPLIAEVMDKEPSAIWLLGAGAMIASVACVAVRWTRWMLLIFVPLGGFVLVALTSEIRDPYVGPAIIEEAGYSYVATGWFAALLPLVGCVAGWFMNRCGKTETYAPAPSPDDQQ